MWPFLLIVSAVGAVAYLAARSAAAAPALTTYGGGPGIPTSVISPTGMGWVAAGNTPNLTAGGMYRWSIARQSTRTQPEILVALAQSFDQPQAWVDSWPPDWPLDDRGPGRNRLQGVPKADVALVGPDGKPDPSLLVWQGFPPSGQTPNA